MKYVLGTAQFGLNYGISNSTGKVSSNNIEQILRTAIHQGVNYLDTANVYGDAEEKIGKFFDLTKQFKLITKTAHTKEDYKIKENIQFIKKELIISLDKMKRDKVDILLVHDTKDILNKEGSEFFRSLIEIKDSGIADRIGVSVYTMQELSEILEKYSVDVVQLPLNVFNQNFLKSGILKELNRKGIEIHARSVFLQGLLLMKTSELNDYFNKIKVLHSSYQEVVFRNKLSLVEGALNFIKSVKEIDAIIFGVQDSTQLNEIINSLETKLIDIDYKNFSVDDESITNPSKWIN
ncbi:MAG: aryl-alcohol dehydrogenase [Candidatus Marinimicrobia bacterium]|nr:aryl-alcohol dehydrogenase [Candidatus Neomarinimicrobiota bacterium]|tara:strand:+ start:4122 stop:5000 length:879 start_codon:yes stop_codon:yes gene_type:complete